jgi:NAD(P) transhydrogenase subunit alpha
MVSLFIPKERRPGETRVAATPETVKRMVKLGYSVAVEAGAGESAWFPDADYATAGATLAADPQAAAARADAVLAVAPEAALPQKSGALLMGLLAPYHNSELVRDLAARGISSLSMELVPRITRAQEMDALSSQASIAGYKAVLLAAARVPRYFPLLMTAAGTIPPSRVVVLGAGVAGLQALATARRLGAVVEVSDVRPAVKEQVQSLGGRFIDLPEVPSGEGSGGYAKEMGEEFLRKQREIVKSHLATANVVITTALIPGRPAPLLITADMAEALAPGSVVVDLAAEQGGNCELSEADREVVHRGVLYLSPTNLPATLQHDASSLYARNVLALLNAAVRDGQVAIDPADDVIGAALLTHGGKIHHEPTAQRLAAPSGAGPG